MHIIRFNRLVIIISILGILFLYFLSTISQPKIIELYEIPSYEGKLVIVEGLITDYRTTTYGSQIIEIISENNNKTTNTYTTIFIEKETPVEYGDKIQATGKVQKYKDTWEIIANNEKSIKIIQKWQNISFPLWQLAQNPEKYINVNVNISGKIDRIYDGYFYLNDLDGTYSILVYSDSAFLFNISIGDRVTIAAKFYYDISTLQYVLKLEEPKHMIQPIVKE